MIEINQFRLSSPQARVAEPHRITVALGSAFGFVGGVQSRVSFVLRLACTCDPMSRASTRRSRRIALKPRRPTFGRTYLWIFWVSQITLLVVSVLVYGSSAFVAMVAGYLAFALFRELVTIRGTRHLERLIGAQL
jgi:hypothetical protein